MLGLILIFIVVALLIYIAARARGNPELAQQARNNILVLLVLGAVIVAGLIGGYIWLVTAIGAGGG
jgi:hypothetical protein